MVLALIFIALTCCIRSILIHLLLSLILSPSVDLNNVTKSSLGIITFPIKVGHVTLPTLIHVISGELTYNLLLGRPWIHSMQVVPFTLHKQIKFIHNNTTYTLLGDTRFQVILQTSSYKSSSINSSLTILDN